MSPRFRSGAWLAALVLAFVATHLPPPDAPPPILKHDKLLHVLGYAVLGLLTGWRIAADCLSPASRRFWGWLLALIAYAGFDELTQPVVGRSCELGDWLADAGGAAAGMLAVWLSCVHAARRI